jgi:hypothetical protein
MALNLGGVIRLTYLVKDAAGTATTPAGIVLTITNPDGTTTLPTVPAPGTPGSYVVDFVPAQAGLHSVHWATTAPTTAEDDVFTAEAPARMLVSVDEAIAHLRSQSVTVSDADREQLQWLCIAATDAVERDLDRVIVPRAVTETHNGASGAIILRRTPVISVSSVTESGVLVDPSGYLLDPQVGFLYRGTSAYSARWGVGMQNVVITYRAGYADPPRVVRIAALNLIQSMWQQSQQAYHPALDESSTEAFATAAIAGLSQIPGYDSLRSAAVA